MLRLIFSEKHASNKGFTLIEMMVVVAIVAILAAISIPLYQKYMDNAKSSEAVTTMGQIAGALNSYYTQKGGFPSSVTSSILKEAHVPVNGYTGAISYSDISGFLNTLDISGSTNWTYQVNVLSDTSSQFCITATAINVSSGAFSNGIFYVNDLSGFDSSIVSLFEGNFYKNSLYQTDTARGKVPDGLGLGGICVSPSTS
ncbi:MAG: prepilin-type N-terminal cleavage/methylation domain-containing protein [Nitrospirae bacterium]|nr:prepilin-type N-terminal cleavage/methylation domain-containing protein [Nitrospirota bacterium]